MDRALLMPHQDVSDAVLEFDEAVIDRHYLPARIAEDSVCTFFQQ